MLSKNYRVREAAEWLGIRERTLWDWIYKGKIRSARVGHCRVIPEEQLRELVVYSTPRKQEAAK